jgi:hypothetical protein
VSKSDEPADETVPAEVAALGTTQAQKNARAYHLRFVQNQSLEYIAQAEKCSISTAWRRSEAGKAQAAFLRSTDDEVRNALADGAGWLVGALAAEQQTVGGSWLEYAPAILKALKFEAEIRGALATRQVAIQGRVGVGPDPNTIAAIQALLEQEGGTSS